MTALSVSPQPHTRVCKPGTRILTIWPPSSTTVRTSLSSAGGQGSTGCIVTDVSPLAGTWAAQPPLQPDSVTRTATADADPIVAMVNDDAPDHVSLTVAASPPPTEPERPRSDVALVLNVGQIA